MHMLDGLTGTRRSRVALFVCWLACSMAAAHVVLSAAQVDSVRLYVIDMGGRPPGPTLSTSPAYLVVHPKGTLLWDTGGLPDSYVGSNRSREELGAAVQTYAVEKTLKQRLADIGYTPAQITFFALSHYHYDHSANANDYAGSTWLVQRAEHDAMFAEPPPPMATNVPGGAADFRTYSALKNSKTVIIENKDHDVFGDGTVVIKFTPGHTPGGQALFVKLAKFGPVLVTGDVYHSAAEHVPPFTAVPSIDTSKEQTIASRVSLEAFLKQTGAAFWIPHDVKTFQTLKKSPDYYD